MGFLSSLFKDHLRTDRNILRTADIARREVFHGRSRGQVQPEQKPQPPQQMARAFVPNPSFYRVQANLCATALSDFKEVQRQWQMMLR